MTSARTGQRRTKYYKDDPQAVARRNLTINAVSRLAEQIAGGRTRYRAISPEERARFRATAHAMHELGADFTTAEKAEKTDRRGFVYVISNPAWPHHVKIGRAFDPESRLRSYFTGCPFNDYVVENAMYFHDCYMAERETHARLEAWRADDGEWFNLTPDEAADCINQLREII